MRPCFSRKGTGKRLGQQVDASQSRNFAGPTQTASPTQPVVPPAEGNDVCNHGRRIASPRAAILIVEPRQHAIRLALIDAALDEIHKLIAQIRGAHACTDVHVGAAHAHLPQNDIHWSDDERVQQATRASDSLGTAYSVRLGALILNNIITQPQSNKHAITLPTVDNLVASAASLMFRWRRSW